MMKKELILISSSLSIILTGCQNYLQMSDAASVGVAGLSSLAAYELAPEKWSNSEKAALTAGVGVASFVVSKLIAGKINEDVADAYIDGFNNGRAITARTQYEITQNLQKAQNYQKSKEYQHKKLYMLDAPVKSDANYVSSPIYLEVFE